MQDYSQHSAKACQGCRSVGRAPHHQYLNLDHQHLLPEMDVSVSEYMKPQNLHINDGI